MALTLRNGACEVRVSFDAGPLTRALRRIVSALGTRADSRRRPRRVQRKIDKRGGFMRHHSAGAQIHSVR